MPQAEGIAMDDQGTPPGERAQPLLRIQETRGALRAPRCPAIRIATARRALDPEMVREVLDVILSLAKEASTMVIVTHEMELPVRLLIELSFLDEAEKSLKKPIQKHFYKSKTKGQNSF